MSFHPFLNARDTSLRRVFAAAFLIVLAKSTFAVSPAEFVARRADVITVDMNRPRAEAFAVASGKSVAVGSDAEWRRLSGRPSG